MPWTGSTFKKKHAKDLSPAQAKKAAEVANKVLAEGGDEGKAIRIGISAGKKHKEKK